MSSMQKLFRKASGSVSKKDINGKRKSGESAGNGQGIGRTTPSELYSGEQYQPKPVIDLEAENQRALEAQRAEEEERRRVIEQLQAKEAEDPVPQAPMATVAQQSKVYPDKRKTNPGLSFIRELAKTPNHRLTIAEIIKSHSKDELSPKEEVVAYINDCGYAVADLAGLSTAAEFAKCEELLTWSSRYNLFIQWSPDKQHPWDKLADSADISSATLEIGQNADGLEAVVLLDGVRVPEWTFKNGRFNTTRPISWLTPSLMPGTPGEDVLVHLELNFNVFTGYSGSLPDTLQYFGPQCQGVMWPASQDFPVNWPVSPPIVVGKVNIASRMPALSPGHADSITEYCGIYRTFFLTTEQDQVSQLGPELEITYSDSADAMVVALDGVPLRDWTLSPNNTLSWDDSHHGSGTLILQRLRGGPFLFGDIKPASTPFLATSNSAGYSVFGELKSQVSRLSPTGVMNSGLANKVALGLQSSAAILTGEILTLSHRIQAGEDVSQAQATRAKQLLDLKISHLEAIEKLAASTAHIYLKSGGDNTLVLDTAIYDDVVPQVYTAFQSARAESEIAMAKAQLAEKDASATREAELATNVASATYHAAQTSLRAQEAAKACAAAERFAETAASLALNANTALALDAAITAAQSFSIAQKACLRAAKEENIAAQAALKCVSANIEQFVRQADFERLRDVAQASNIATKVLASSMEAVKGWESNTVVSRLSALQAANRAAADAQECNKITRRMQPVAPGGLLSQLSSNQAFDLSSVTSLDSRLPSTPPRSEGPPKPMYYDSPGSVDTQVNYE